MLFLASSMRLLKAIILPGRIRKKLIFSFVFHPRCSLTTQSKMIKLHHRTRYIGLSRISLHRHCGFPQVSSSAPGNTKLFSVLLWIVITVVIFVIFAQFMFVPTLKETPFLLPFATYSFFLPTDIEELRHRRRLKDF